MTNTERLALTERVQKNLHKKLPQSRNLSQKIEEEFKREEKGA